MIKKELLKKLVEEGVVETLVAGEQLLKDIDRVVEVSTSVEGKTKIGDYFTVECVEVAEKSGEVTRVVDGVKVKMPYTKEAHTEIAIKRTSKCKNV